MTTLRRILATLALLAAPLQPLAAAPVALASPAHSHNDYRQIHPLDTALEMGFSSIEADIWLQPDGALLVGHTAQDVVPGRSLQSLYLDPLRARIAANGGRVYAGDDRPVILLIDLKSEGAATYAALSAVLATYQDVMTWWEGEVVHPGAVLPVITGNMDRVMIAREDPRRAAIDANLKDSKTISPQLTPMASEKWGSMFHWTGEGEMPEAELSRLREAVRMAHDADRVLRFYATPDGRGAARDRLWTRLLDEGVDLINTDDPRGLRAFLDARGR